MLLIKDMTQLQYLLNQNSALKCILVLDVGEDVEYVAPLKFWHCDDLDFFYRAVHHIMQTPPKPFCAAGFGFIDKNFSKLDTARFFGVFEVDIWLKPAPNLTPKIYTVRLEQLTNFPSQKTVKHFCLNTLDKIQNIV